MLFLVLSIILTGIPKASMANGLTSSGLKKQIEKEYGFIINVPSKEFGESSEKDRLFFYKDLDNALNSLNKKFIREITDYYKSKGIKSILKIDLPLWSFDTAGYFSLSANVATVSIENIHPQSRQSINRYTLAHEIGHMINFALDYKEGSTNIKDNWIKIDDKELDKSKSHITDYAQTSFREDFAETFKYMASRGIQDELFKIMLNAPKSIIIEKMNYLDSLISKHFKSYKGLDTFNFVKPDNPSQWSKVDINRIIREGRLKNLSSINIRLI